MRSRITMVVGFAVGYVLGAKAGRVRYEQMRAMASRGWNRRHEAFEKAQAMAEEVSPGLAGAIRQAGGSVVDLTDRIEPFIAAAHVNEHPPLAREQ